MQPSIAIGVPQLEVMSYVVYQVQCFVLVGFLVFRILASCVLLASCHNHKATQQDQLACMARRCPRRSQHIVSCRPCIIAPASIAWLAGLCLSRPTSTLYCFFKRSSEIEVRGTRGYRLLKRVRRSCSLTPLPLSLAFFLRVRGQPSTDGARRPVQEVGWL